MNAAPASAAFAAAVVLSLLEAVAGIDTRRDAGGVPLHPDGGSQSSAGWAKSSAQGRAGGGAAPPPNPAATMMMHQFVLIIAAFAIGAILMIGLVLFILYKTGLAGMVMKGAVVPAVLVDATNSAASKAGAPPPKEEQEKEEAQKKGVMGRLKSCTIQ